MNIMSFRTLCLYVLICLSQNTFASQNLESPDEWVFITSKPSCMLCVEAERMQIKYQSDPCGKRVHTISPLDAMHMGGQMSKVYDLIVSFITKTLPAKDIKDNFEQILNNINSAIGLDAQYPCSLELESIYLGAVVTESPQFHIHGLVSSLGVIKFPSNLVSKDVMPKSMDEFVKLIDVAYSTPYPGANNELPENQKIYMIFPDRKFKSFDQSIFLAAKTNAWTPESCQQIWNKIGIDRSCYLKKNLEFNLYLLQPPKSNC